MWALKCWVGQFRKGVWNMKGNMKGIEEIWRETSTGNFWEFSDELILYPGFSGNIWSSSDAEVVWVQTVYQVSTIVKGRRKRTRQRKKLNCVIKPTEILATLRGLWDRYCQPVCARSVPDLLNHWIWVALSVLQNHHIIQGSDAFVLYLLYP